MNNKIPTISVLIPDAEDWLTVKVLRCLGQSSKVKAHLLSRKRKPLSRYSRFCASFHYNNSQNDDEWIDEINKLITKLKINLILPVKVKGVELISKNRARISESARIPPLAEPEKIALTNDKWAFHNFLLQHDLPSIPTIYAGNSGEDINVQEMDSVEYPALLKPVSEAGGFGIVKVEKAEDLKEAWRDKRIMKNHEYIFQSYIPADHFSLSVCSRDGEILAYTIYHSLFQPNPYRIGVLQEFKNHDAILNIGRKLLSELEWNGVANIDFLVDNRDKSVKILEFNPRFWQSLLGSASAGVNFPLLYCLDAMGATTTFRKRHITFANTTMYTKTLLSLLRGKRSTTRIRWRESGLRYSVADPLPELVEIIHKRANIFRSLSNGKRHIQTNNLFI